MKIIYTILIFYLLFQVISAQFWRTSHSTNFPNDDNSFSIRYSSIGSPSSEFGGGFRNSLSMGSPSMGMDDMFRRHREFHEQARKRHEDMHRQFIANAMSNFPSSSIFGNTDSFSGPNMDPIPGPNTQNQNEQNADYDEDYDNGDEN